MPLLRRPNLPNSSSCRAVLRRCPRCRLCYSRSLVAATLRQLPAAAAAAVSPLLLTGRPCAAVHTGPLPCQLGPHLLQGRDQEDLHLAPLQQDLLAQPPQRLELAGLQAQQAAEGVALAARIADLVFLGGDDPIGSVEWGLLEASVANKTTHT